MKRWKVLQSKKRIAQLGLLTSAAAALVTLLAACNTTEGVGKDIESAGEGLQEAAQDAKD